MCVGSDRTGASAPSAPDAGGYSFAAGAGEASERRTTATSNARHARAQTRAALTVRASTNRLETDKEAHPTPRVGGLQDRMPKRMPRFLLHSLHAKLQLFSLVLVVVPGALFALIALARARG